MFGGVSLDNVYVVYWNLSKGGLFDRMPVRRAVFGYNCVKNDVWIYDYHQRFVGNVTYLYNYEGAPNGGYYWVDDYSLSTIEFIPPEPQRDGYKFDGWYKEMECLNKWDFSVDVTGKKIVLEHNENHDVYEGIYLYAKWIEN